MSTPATLLSRRVLIDTSAYFALTDRDQNAHQKAIAIQHGLIVEARHLFTTNYILAETHALVLTRLGRDVAARVLQEIDRSTVTIVRVTGADERRARAIIDQYNDKDFSLTDGTSFAVMERLRISVAFTLDRNFAQYGLQVLGS